MKTDKIYFHCRNNEIDNDLVRAIEALPDGMSIIPYDAEIGCMKKDDKVLIYPYNPKGLLFTMEHIVLENYEQCLEYSKFKIKDFSYVILRYNPFEFYEKIIKNKLYEQVMKEEEKKEKTIEDCIWVAHSE